jgi:hypothetical protein
MLGSMGPDWLKLVKLKNDTLIYNWLSLIEVGIR